MFEYKVVPAPKKGLKGKGVKGGENRFANALEAVMNDLGKLGWEYIRTDTLPAEEREGLMGRTTVFQNMLIFRRPLKVEDEFPKDAPSAIQEDETPLLEDKSNEIEQQPEAEVEAEAKAEAADTISNEPSETDAPATFRREPRVSSD